MTVRHWVFGYGSLVSPPSLARTIGREPSRSEVVVAQLSGYGRRWNYGSLHLRGSWEHDGVRVEEGLVVSLGLELADERCNGVCVQVSDDELARLDHRERDYDRVDVTDQIAPEDDGLDGPVVTYVPRPSSVDRYLLHRDQGRAAVRQEYWDLVHRAFADLGPGHLAQMEATPDPDVPVVDLRLAR